MSYPTELSSNGARVRIHREGDEQSVIVDESVNWASARCMLWRTRYSPRSVLPGAQWNVPEQLFAMSAP
jgi:hypothetical protein